MDAWIGALIGVCGTLAGTGLTGFLSWRRDKDRALDATAEAERQREHDRIERRFDRRVETYSEFLTVINNAVSRAIKEFNLGMRPPEQRKEPEARWSWSAISELSMLRFVGSRAVVEAAEKALDAASAFTTTFDPEHTGENFPARDRFVDAVRRDLGIESGGVITPR